MINQLLISGKKMNLQLCSISNCSMTMVKQSNFFFFTNVMQQGSCKPTANSRLLSNCNFFEKAKLTISQEEGQFRINYKSSKFHHSLYLLNDRPWQTCVYTYALSLFSFFVVLRLILFFFYLLILPRYQLNWEPDKSVSSCLLPLANTSGHPPVQT